jgi:hypothetical protein
MALVYHIPCQQSHCRTRRMGMQIFYSHLCRSLTIHLVQDFHKKHSPHYSLTTILPTYIGGPNVLPLTKGINSFSVSQATLWKTATASQLPKPDFPGWIDVRDVAKAHVNALVTPQAAGKRWILCTAQVSYSDVRSPSFYSVGDFQISWAFLADCRYCEAQLPISYSLVGSSESRLGTCNSQQYH